MSWYDLVLPPHVVVQEDLQSRGVDFKKWQQLTQQNEKLLHMLSQCYARHNFGHRKFDEHLHKTGVNLRLNAHCEWLLQEYPEVRRAENT